MATEIKSLAQFIDRVSKYQPSTNHTLFRGQSKRGNLLPGIARDDPKVNTTPREKEMLKQFLRLGATRIPVQYNTIWDQLVLAQHYGMKTRLLDWSTNPLVAMFFACSAWEKGDVYVYSLIADSFLMPNPDTDPFQPERTWVVLPNLGNDRIVAQHGCFTAHAYANKAGKFVALEHNVKMKTYLTEYLVTAKIRGEILGQLDRCGINRSTLFPDLEGLGRYLNWREENGELPLPTQSNSVKAKKQSEISHA